MASLRKEYGVPPKEYRDMKWDEFKALLSGLGPDTALGRIVAIRGEDDKESLKLFTSEQKKIRNEYRKRHAKTVTTGQMDIFLKDMRNMLVAMAGEAIISEKE